MERNRGEMASSYMLVQCDIKWAGPSSDDVGGAAPRWQCGELAFIIAAAR